jgi:hypothetical protein
MLNAILLIVTSLYVIMLSVVFKILSHIMLRIKIQSVIHNVIILSVVLLNAIMLSVAAPPESAFRDCFNLSVGSFCFLTHQDLKFNRTSSATNKRNFYHQTIKMETSGTRTTKTVTPVINAVVLYAGMFVPAILVKNFRVRHELHLGSSKN